MKYEFHVTVEASSTIDWMDCCNQLGLKPLIIQLEEGQHPIQMMSSTHLVGDWKFAQSYADFLKGFITDCGFKVLRIKIEIPSSDYVVWERLEEETVEYFECHIRVNTVNVKRLIYLRSHLDVGISHSVLKGHLWLTKRYSNPMNVHNFLSIFETVKKEFPDVEMHSEAVLMDTNKDLDMGWLPGNM